MRTIRFVTAIALVAALASTAMAGGRNPGSVLVYPVVRSDTPVGAPNAAFFTIVCVTNTNLNPVGGSTNVHYEYANTIPNPNNPFCPLGCIIFDRVELLTPADTLCVLAQCHNAVGGGTSGYLVASAEDPGLFDTPWSHNFLVGSELVVNGATGMYSVNAIPFTSPFGDGAATDADGDGQLDFDGVEYEEVPEILLIDSFVAAAGSSLALINLTGGPNAQNTVLFQVWNDNEFLLSSTLTFCCWFDAPLENISPLFNQNFLANNTPDDPNELDLDCNPATPATLETGWARIDSILVTTLGGTIIDFDGAMLGAITAGPGPGVDGGHLLWESVATQANGQFVDFGQ